MRIINRILQSHVEEATVGLRLKYNELLEKESKISKELEKYKGWENNPFLMLKKVLPELESKDLEDYISKTGPRPLEFDINTLSKEEREQHLSQISTIHRAEAFHRELDTYLKDIQKRMVLLVEDDKSLFMLRQLLTFVLGIRMRFALLSKLFDEEKKPKDKVDSNHPIGN